jgi:hypothetical protein
MIQSLLRIAGIVLLLCVLAACLPAADGPGAPVPPGGPTTAAKPKAKPDAARRMRQQIMLATLLDHFNIGVEAPKAWHADARATNGATFDFTVGYLSAGVGKDTPWFFKYGNSVENRILDCKSLGMGVWFTWYMLSQSMPADYKPGPAQACPANAKVASTMALYYDWFKKTLIECGKHPDVPIVMQIEPDEWCHLLISGKMDPNNVDVKVGSCGMPELAGLPDNEFGFAKAFAKLRDLYAPYVLLCCNPSGWDSGGSMSGAKMGATFKAMCGDDYDLACFETADRDKGAAGSNQKPPYGDKVGICGTFKNHIEWIKEFHEVSGFWVCLWQVAMGNTYYTSCDNTPGHRCDNLAQFILEHYPKDDGIPSYVDAGCCGWMFNAGQGDCTAVWDAKKDGITTPDPIEGSEGHKALFADDDGGFMRVFGGKYYQHPYMIFGKHHRGTPGLAGAKSATMASAASDGAGGSDQPAAAEKPARTAKLTDADAAAHYSGLLLKRVQEEMAANRLLKFTYAVLKDTVRIDAVGADGTLSLHMEDGGNMDVAWSSLNQADLLQLAQAQARENHPQDHALLAFYLLLAGKIDEAESQLGLATGYDQPVRKCFTIQ